MTKTSRASNLRSPIAKWPLRPNHEKLGQTYPRRKRRPLPPGRVQSRIAIGLCVSSSLEEGNPAKQGRGGFLRATAHLRGFTLMELTVVLVVLILLAALIVPSVFAIKRSREDLSIEASILRLPTEARNAAREANVPVTMRVDNDALVIEQTPTDGDPKEVKRVTLNADIQVESARTGEDTTDTGSWTWVVYPDGSSDSGGLQFTEGDARKSLVLPSNGNAQWVDGDLPETTDSKWTAGELEQRA